MNQETLNVVEQTEVFIEKFNSISCYVWYGDPLGIDLDYVGNAIKIIYKNDEYELVLCNGKAIYNAELGFSNYRGYRVFDKEQFDALINEYLSNENTTV